MVFELCRAIKLAPTTLTLELSILVMAAHVVLQVALRDELLIANLALVVAVAEV
jgi:hypothetical protein